MTLLQDLDEKQIKWITNRATLRLRRLSMSRLKFYDDFDEWGGYTIPARLGGGTVDVNYFIYGSNRLQATVYGYDDKNGQIITNPFLTMKSIRVRIHQNEEAV